jgi:hypothetical protein
VGAEDMMAAGAAAVAATAAIAGKSFPGRSKPVPK